MPGSDVCTYHSAKARLRPRFSLKFASTSASTTIFLSYSSLREIFSSPRRLRGMLRELAA